MSQIVLKQAVIMLILIVVGAGCFKLKLLSKETVNQISGLVLKVVNPVVILMAYQREFKPELVQNLGYAFLASAISYVVAFVVAYVCIPKKEGREIVIERFSSIYSNCGFMGIPLVQAMFQSEGVFYLTAYLTMFNALVWSHGVMQMSGERSLKSLGKILRSPAIIAIILGMILFFGRIMLPNVIAETFEMIGSLNSPLAMIVAGATIIQTNLPEVVKKPRIFYVCLLKLLVIPVLTIFALTVISADTTVEMTVTAATAAPSAAICTMQCLNYKKNASYASEIFAVTTLFSVATMPLMMVIYEKVGAWIG